MMPDTITKIKTSIRINHSKLDEDIQSDIDACLADLRVHGIVHKDVTDPLIFNAVKLYCKASYTDDVAKAAEFRQRYIALRDSLKDAEGYGWEGESDE
jgi:hypothetical protein